MREREFYLPSSDGNSRLHCMEWLPDGEILGAIQIVHGMMEHTGRYRETAEWLADRGSPSMATTIWVMEGLRRKKRIWGTLETEMGSFLW